MDDTKDLFCENSGLNDQSGSEVSEQNEIKQYSPIILDEKELNERGESSQWQSSEKDIKNLEPVLKYAQRIKSFLGWEPYLEEVPKDGYNEKLVGQELEDHSIKNQNKGCNADINASKEIIQANNIEDKIEANSETQDIPPKYELERTDNDERIFELKYDTKRTDEPKIIDELIFATDETGENEPPGVDQIIYKTGDKNGRDPPEIDKLISQPNVKNESPKRQGDKRDDHIEEEAENCPESKSNLGETLSKTSEIDHLVNSDWTSTGSGLHQISIESNLPPDVCFVKNNEMENLPSLEESQQLEFDVKISTENEHQNVENLLQINPNNSERLADFNQTCLNNDIVSDEHEVKAILSETNVNYSSISIRDKNNKNFTYGGSDNQQENSKEDLLRRSYPDQIRRLSLAIVNYIIAEAKNTVNEQYSNKNEDSTKENIVEISNKLTNTFQADEDSHFINSPKSLEEEENRTGKNETGLDINSFVYFATDENRETFEFKPIESLDRNLNKKDSDTECGFDCFKPPWIQQYATPKVYLVLFSIIGIIHSCYYSFIVSVMSTLEKRYAFQSKISGTILMADELTPLLLGVGVGYLGGRMHRPRMVALGMFASAASLFVAGLPYLIYGSAKHLSSFKYRNETGPEFCGAEMKTNICDDEAAPATMTAVSILFFASFLKGFAAVTYYVFGVSYMDDNIKKKNSPLYLAIALALRLLGPLVGFLMSSVFLKFYENPLEDPGYGPEDPRWVGAWWIGFFLQGVLLAIFTLPIALFPKRLPGQRSMETNTAPSNQFDWKQIYLGLVTALKRLGKNPVFIILIINTNMKIFGQFGHAIMLPKYMENQFRLSASQASLYSGATSITFIMLATVVGGFIIWKFRPRIKVLLSGMIISEVVMCAGFLVLMIPRCQTADMVNFGTNDEGLILKGVCNQQCDCSKTSFTPFCGKDSKLYFSPCYAGCTEETASSSKAQKEFGNCSCFYTTEDEQFKSIISEGFCPDENCWSQAVAYLIILLIIVSISNGFTVVHTMILLRSVDPNDKSIALGTFETFICLFGFIPFPITIGALVDSACLVWEESCGETGNCWFYDMDKFAYLLHGVSAAFCFLSVLCLLSLYFLKSRVRDLYAEEDEEKEYVDIKLDTVSGSFTKL